MAHLILVLSDGEMWEEIDEETPTIMTVSDRQYEALRQGEYPKWLELGTDQETPLIKVIASCQDFSR